MNLKKLLSASLAGIMALSMITAADAEETAAEPTGALGTKTYKLVYYNGFDSEEEQANTPILMYSLSKGTSSQPGFNNNQLYQWLEYKKESTSFLYIDMKNGLGDNVKLTPGNMYELSFTEQRDRNPTGNLKLGLMPELTYYSLQTVAAGLGINNTSELIYAEKSETKTVKVTFAYNPSKHYFAIAEFGGGGGNYAIDNVTLREIGVLDSEFVNTNYPDSMLNKKLSSDSAVAMTDIKTIDLTATKNNLTAGEETDLIAYLQDSGEKMSDIIAGRQRLDSSALTVTTENSGIVAYENGKLKALGAGTAVITVSDGTTSANAVITVHESNAEKLDLINGGATTWIKVKNPTDGTEEVSTSKNIDDVKTSFTTDGPVAIRFQKYFNGTEDSMKNAVQPFDILFGARNIINRDIITKYGEAYKSSIKPGWNDFAFISSWPGNDANRSSSVAAYVNGEKICTVWYSQASASEGQGNISVNSLKSSNKPIEQFDIFRSFEIVSLKESPKINSVSVENGEPVSTLGTIGIIFSAVPTIEDGAITVASESYGAVDCNVMQDGMNITVKPIGLKPNTSYTLSIDKSKITSNGMTYGNDTATYSFTTDSTNIAAVMGEGYVVTNALQNVIEPSEVDGSLKIKRESGEQTINAKTLDSSWGQGNIKPDRYKFTFDVKREYQWAKKGILDRVGVIAYSGNSPVVFSSLRNDHNADVGADTYDLLKIYSDTTESTEYGTKNITAEYPIKWSEYANVELTLDVVSRTESGVTYNVKAVFTQGASAYVLSCDGVTASGDITKFGLVDKTADHTSDDYYYVKNVNIYAGIKGEADYELSGMTVTSGEEVINGSDGLNGKNITVSYTLKNNKLLDNQPYAAIAAVYESGTQKMIDADVKTGNVAKGEAADIVNNLDLTKYTDGSYVLKVIIWNSLEEAKPIVNIVTDPFEK